MPSMSATFDPTFAADNIRVIRGNRLDGSVDLGINGDVFTVSQVRCEICDGWGPCPEHLALAQQAVRLHMGQMALPFDTESEHEYQEWQALHDSLGFA